MTSADKPAADQAADDPIETETAPEAAAPAADPADPVDPADDPAADRLMEHEYDGIREYDNPLPFWWSGIFVLTIIHAGWYFFWYHGGGPGKSIHEEYADDLAAYQARRAAAPVEELVLDEDTLRTMASDPNTVEHGEAVFVKNCTSCHTENGRGLVGPNLTDNYQIHGSTRADLFRTIHDGVPDKGMIAWSPVLPPDDLGAVAAFVITLRGTNMPGGKAPDGAPVGEFQ